MKYSELMKRLEKSKALRNHTINCENNIITVEYAASTISDEITKTTYNVIISEELKDLMKITGETKLDRCFGILINDVNEDTVKIYPKYNLNIGGYISWKAYNNYYLLYNNDIIISSQHVTKNCIRCPEYVEKPIGIYNNYLIAKYNEKICSIDTKGNIVEIYYYPEPEDGREDHLRTKIEDDTLYVSVYCYYDNDWHHGGWEENKFDLKEITKDFKKSIIVRTLQEYMKNNAKDSESFLSTYCYRNIFSKRNCNNDDIVLYFNYYHYKKRYNNHFMPSSNRSFEFTVRENNGELIIEINQDDEITFFDFSKYDIDETMKRINDIYKKYI